MNPANKMVTGKDPLLKRLYVYQKERFPLIGHGLLVASFSFSAISYSRICRNTHGFVNLSVFLVGIFTTITLFMLVRILDEFKDAEDDKKYRPHLPVPRGLMRLSELRNIGWILFVLQIGVNAWFQPKMLGIFAGVILYLALMSKEFFVSKWLKAHQFWYVTSHMFIIPLIDIYASGLDWYLADAEAPTGLLFFFAVSYMNGIVLEIGRKIRAPQNESEGVLTYSAMLGKQRSVGLWLGALLLTLGLSIAASAYAGYGQTALIILGLVFILCAAPALFFLRKADSRSEKAIELASALWTIAMYLCLGGIPMMHQLIRSI